MAGPPARQESLTADAARWLVGEGRLQVAAVESSWTPGADRLQLVTGLRRQGLEAWQAALVVDAARARVGLRPALAAAGWPPDLDVLLTAAAAEQASDPRVAAHRARRYAGVGTVLDLGCGAGMDAIALARAAGRVEAVDLDPARVLLCEHHLAAAGVTGRAVEGDALASSTGAEVPTAHWHADPGRRPGGRRARSLGQTEPPVADLVRAVGDRPGGGLVVSPGVAWDDPDLPVGEVEFVQVGPSLVEAVVWIGDLAGEAEATATILEPQGEGTSLTRRRNGPAPEVPIGPVGEWLLDPAPAAARARVHHELALEHGAHRISSRRALCSADEPSRDGWWTNWRVEADLPGRPRAVARWLRDQQELPLSVELHGDVGDVKPWWQALRGHPTGPVGRRIHVVATDDSTRAYVTTPLA